LKKTREAPGQRRLCFWPWVCPSREALPGHERSDPESAST
jgi:hypothetical protein